MEEKIKELEAMMEISKQLLDAAYKVNNLKLINEASSRLAGEALALHCLKDENERWLVNGMEKFKWWSTEYHRVGGKSNYGYETNDRN